MKCALFFPPKRLHFIPLGVALRSSCIYETTQLGLLEVHKHDGQEVNTLVELCYPRLLDR